MSTWKFLPFDPQLPEDAPPGDRITPLLPPPPDEPTEPAVQMRVSEIPDAWERQAGEGEDAYHKFLAYRDAPRPRRMVRPGAGNTAELYKVAREWNWFQRIEAYDRYIDRIRLEEVRKWNEQDAREVTAEHMAILRDMREFAAIEMSRILERAKQAAIDGTMKPAEVIRLTEVMLKYDRLLRNQSTESTLVVSETNLSEMTIDELREAQSLVQKMTKKAT